MVIKNKIKGFGKKSIVAILLFSFLFLSFPGSVVHADGDDASNVVQNILTKVWEKTKDLSKTLASTLYQNTLRTALYKLAADSATYLGSGLSGSKSVFTSEYWTEYGKAAGEAAVGQAIDMLSKEWNFNLCEPNLDIKTKLSLGLAYTINDGPKPNCSFSQLEAGWKNELDRWKAYADDPMLVVDQVLNSINPESSDIGVAMKVSEMVDLKAQEERKKIEEQTKYSGGWLDVRNIGGKAKGIPGSSKQAAEDADFYTKEGFGKITGDILTDTANIFLNQYFITLTKDLLRQYSEYRAGKGDDGKPSSEGVLSEESDPSARQYSKSVLTESLTRILRPKYAEVENYNVLTELMSCADSAGYSGPNNCVISSSFGRAIQNKKTLIEAIESGDINPGMTFSVDGDFNTTLNQRTLMILRKFRIVPLGWEEALARVIKQQKGFGGQYTIMDLVSCFSDDDEYNTYSKKFPHSPDDEGALTWCRGLVDPSWVLKSPHNYCARQGYGGHVLSTQILSIPETKDSEGNITSEGVDNILVVRSGNYCADERSCIKENPDGTCQFYGYCIEEKRTWNFNADSCSPEFNTCDSFTSTSGKKLSLLKNTIENIPCSADNSGCSVYSQKGTYSLSSNQVKWSSDNVFYLNSKAEACSGGTAEGCNEFIRTRSKFGHNFLVNGDFETNEGWDDYFNEEKIQEGVGHDGGRGIVLGSDEFLNGSAVVGPEGDFLRGESFTLGFYSKCTATSTALILGMSGFKEIPPSEDFIYNSFSHIYPDGTSGNRVNFQIKVGNSGQCYFDKLKVEKGMIGTFYSDYRGDGLVYIKTIPEYLENICYNNPHSSNPDYSLKNDAPDVCSNYSRLCNRDELGCDLFGFNDGRSLAAKAMDRDYCPQECVGYNIYVQSKSAFESPRPYRLIPTTAKECSASGVGCTEFTNIEDLSSGGEEREYYTYLRQCVKPDEGTCSNFYSWEGSAQGGYQLRSFQLAASGSKMALTEGSLSLEGNSYKHKILNTDVCSREIKNLPVSDPRHNPDCREFYDQAGQIFYVLYSKTLTCSEDCKRFRMTGVNIDEGISNATECNSLNSINKVVAKWGSLPVDDFSDDSSSDKFVCIRCLNGGSWDERQGACIYQAIPGEGIPCSSSENLCREYKGSNGNNVRILSSYDFDSLSAWHGGSISQESLENNGQSVRIEPGEEISSLAPDLIHKDGSYLLSFLAKNSSSGSAKIEIYFKNSKGEIAWFKSVDPTSGVSENSLAVNGSVWQVYKANLNILDHDVDRDEKLFIKNLNSEPIYIDDFVLSEISNTHYLIKDSWNTPNICYYDQADNYQGINYNLGCDAYLDRSDSFHFLRQFSKLCDSSSVGCEVMIDTHNYSKKEKAIFVDGELGESLESCPESGDCVLVPADNFSFVVYNQDKICNSADKGCSLMGKAVSNIYSLNHNYLYQNVYIKNNPDKYSQGILCTKNAVGCDSWSSSSGNHYFKDPMDNVCQFVDNKWYIKKIKRCLSPGEADSNTSTLPNPCNSDEDCSAGQKCVLDDNNYRCPLDMELDIIKTIGNGQGRVFQPVKKDDVNWAGLCPAKEAGCTEYIDPESSFYPNIVFNPGFADIDDDGIFFDGWTPVNNDNGTGSLNLSCKINKHNNINCPDASSRDTYYFTQKSTLLEANKLYTIKHENLDSVKIKCKKDIYKLGTNNAFSTFRPGDNYHSIDDQKIVFFSGENLDDDCELLIEFGEDTNLRAVSLEWRELIVDYKIKNDLDFSQCNVPNFNNGCVLFNERSIGSFGWPNYNSLRYDSRDYSQHSGSDYKDANEIIKVSPDRVCGKWLSCYSYSTEKDSSGNDRHVCLQIGQCTSMDDSGNCLTFSKSPEGNREFDPGRDANATGYSVLGNYYLDNMTQRGGEKIWGNDFEKYTDFNEWKKLSGNSWESINSNCLITKSADVIGSRVPLYPSPSNMGFVKIGGSECGVTWRSGAVSLNSGQEYYLNFLINTANYKLPETGSSDVVLGKVTGILNDELIKEGEVDIMVSVVNNNWQRVVVPFYASPSWSGNVTIVFSLEGSGDNSWIYLDDINIAPALEVAGSKYISPSCRLYPQQDSIACSSDDRGYGFIEQGWEGYCLQKDPKNQDVCLLWYPVDAILGSSGSDLATAFTGYGPTGPQPKYCSEIDMNSFDLVEYRDVHLYNSNRYCGGGSNEGHFVHNTSNCNGDSNYYSLRSYVWDSNYSYCRDSGFPSIGCSADSKYRIDIYYCVPKVSDRIISVKGETILGQNIPQSSLGVTGDTKDRAICCCSGGGAVEDDDDDDDDDDDGPIQPYNICSSSLPLVDLDHNCKKKCNSFVCNYKGQCYLGTCSSSRNYPIFEFKAEHDFFHNSQQYKSGAGWFKYNDSLKGKPEEDTGVKVLAYNMTRGECESGLYGDKEASSTESNYVKFFPVGSGYDHCRPCGGSVTTSCCESGSGNGACLMSPDKYAPKCSEFVIGTVPWVKRLTSSKYSLRDYGHSLGEPFDQYVLGSPNAPFGAINSKVYPYFNDSVYTRNVGSDTKKVLFGLPYSCTGEKCKYLFYYKKGLQIVIDYKMGKNDQDEPNNDLVPLTPALSGSPVNALKYIFAEIKNDNGSSSPVYSHLAGADGENNTPAPPCNADGCPERDETRICSVYPEVKNIRLSSGIGTVPQIGGNDSNSNLYKITDSGYYTLSFNTIVDPDQSPIKELLVVIKKEGEGWDSVSSLGRQDHHPNPSNPHRLTRFFTPGDYVFAIKVVDNWDFYRCSGLGGFGTGNYNCLRCCENNLKDERNVPDYCEFCQESFLSGSLFTCEKHITPGVPVDPASDTGGGGGGSVAVDY